jgi:hypothetical protein
MAQKSISPSRRLAGSADVHAVICAAVEQDVRRMISERTKTGGFGGREGSQGHVGSLTLARRAGRPARPLGLMLRVFSVILLVFGASRSLREIPAELTTHGVKTALGGIKLGTVACRWFV